MQQFNPLDMTDRKILITGASSGIGRATALYLSKLGATIVLTGRNMTRLEETMVQLTGTGHILVSCDLTKEGSIQKIMDQAILDGKKLSGMVHCAGIPYIMPLKLLDKVHLDEIMDINFRCFVELVRWYYKKKYSENGSIVAISSVAVDHCREFEAGYCISKAAINAAVSSFAPELYKRNIRINAILPGNIDTEMLASTIARLNNSIEMQKNIQSAFMGLGKPEDIASVVAFLISDMSKFITGRLLYADGGWL